MLIGFLFKNDKIKKLFLKIFEIIYYFLEIVINKRNRTKTNTGKQVDYTKAYKAIMLKELGKLAL